jgi:hypothetical protein
MPHEPLLRRAAMPAPTRVLGLPLRPYSIGHELLLTSEDRPAQTQLQALAAAVLICSNTFEENRRMPSDLLLTLKIKLWNRRIRKMDLARELLAFAAYRNEGSLEFPLSEFDSSGSSGHAPGSPLILQLQQFMMLNFRLSENEAWDYPFGLAKQRWCAFYEREGGLRIKNRHEMGFMEFVAEEERKKQCRA